MHNTDGYGAIISNSDGEPILLSVGNIRFVVGNESSDGDGENTCRFFADHTLYQLVLVIYLH